MNELDQYFKERCKMKSNDDNFIEGIHFYYNENNYIVFTEKYHIQRGYCCGNGCRHCPYNYENVAEPLKSKLLAQKQHDKKDHKKNLSEESARSTTKQYSFFEDVYSVVRQIPKGRVTSYGAIANYLGTKLSARMVGWAMNAAHVAKPKVPAHRVVNRNGMLSGKAHFEHAGAYGRIIKKGKNKSGKRYYC